MREGDKSVLRLRTRPPSNNAYNSLKWFDATVDALRVMYARYIMYVNTSIRRCCSNKLREELFFLIVNYAVKFVSRPIRIVTRAYHSAPCTSLRKRLFFFFFFLPENRELFQPFLFLYVPSPNRHYQRVLRLHFYEGIIGVCKLKFRT